MALKFFKQRDIDEMDAGNIPDSFVSYFESLSQERKDEIINARPELAIGLGYMTKPEETEVARSEETSDNLTVDMSATTGALDKTHVDMEEDIFAQIRVNRYEHVDLDEFFVDGARPLEVLTVPDKTEKCMIHRCKFEKKSIKYRTKNGSTYGLVLSLCRECKRVYQEESNVEYVHQALIDRHISHTFYDIGLTNLYLKSNQSAYVMEEQEKIYVPDVWVEENPTCPIHGETLYELDCEKDYAGRKITFAGYYCDQCNKILMRKANIPELIDECALNGIPEIETEPLVKKVPLKKPIPKRDIRPDFFIQDGKRQKYEYDYTADCFKLTEDDTVVISDSIYCNLEGHDTKEVLALIMVKQKREGRKAYLFMVGYCAECQKYYMDEEDYKVVYGLGRPEVTILSDLESDDYHITSGEVFNLERTHLQKLEDEINGEILDIHKQPDYVNPYTAGDYDDGNLSFAKELSKNKYSARLDKLGSYQSKPYNYRVDITADGDTETYYVGAEDIELEDGSRVISFNSDFGHELVNYQTIKVNKDGKEYDIKLSRQFDIENATLFGYANLRTDEDIIFRSGVTDPFLVRVLNMRKKQHNLIDIIATIQENQNKIVDADFKRSIIVQGCAGSGKTMVLLHRLSSLQYKNRYFDFGDKALILTPNDQFSLHIKGLAEGLQLGNIDRESVEQYYINMLIRYSMEFRPDTKLVSEMMVRQDFVDYIYSDEFIVAFDRAYEKVIADRNRLAEILDNLTEAMGQPNRIIDFKDDTRVVEQIRFGVQAMESIVKQHTFEVENAKEKLQKIISRKDFLDKKIPESEEFVNGILKECLPRVYTKIGVYMSNRQNIITQLQAEQERLNVERQKVQSTILMFEKKAQLEELDKRISKIGQKIYIELKKQEDELQLFNLSQEEKTEDEIVTWMEQVMLFIKEVQYEVRLYKNEKEKLERYIEEKNTIVEELIKAQQTLGEVTELKYSDEVIEAIQYLYQRTNEYTLLGTYQMIFNEAVASFKEENNIKTIVGKYHRYDLYAELLFAKRYFKTVHGTIQFMCVDEGQDLALNEYRLIAELNQNDVIFNIFGDTNQLMKPKRGISDWSTLKRLFNAEEYILKENYRNTNQITRFCNSSFDMNVLQTGVDGAKVREIARRELETELSTLNIANERLAILVPRGVQKRRYLHNDLLPVRITDVIGEKIGNGLISLLYVDEAKGIEFDKVYVVGNKMERNEKYIAYTRALSELILVVDETIADYDDGSEKTTNKIRKDSGIKKLKNKTDIGKGTLVWKETEEREFRNTINSENIINTVEMSVESTETISQDEAEKIIESYIVLQRLGLDSEMRVEDIKYIEAFLKYCTEKTKIRHVLWEGLLKNGDVLEIIDDSVLARAMILYIKKNRGEKLKKIILELFVYFMQNATHEKTIKILFDYYVELPDANYETVMRCVIHVFTKGVNNTLVEYLVEKIQEKENVCLMYSDAAIVLWDALFLLYGSEKLNESCTSKYLKKCEDIALRQKDIIGCRNLDIQPKMKTVQQLVENLLISCPIVACMKGYTKEAKKLSTKINRRHVLYVGANIDALTCFFSLFMNQEKRFVINGFENLQVQCDFKFAYEELQKNINVYDHSGIELVDCEKGINIGYSFLAIMYEEGLYVDKNCEKAMELYKKGAIRGELIGKTEMAKLGMEFMIENGILYSYLGLHTGKQVVKIPDEVVQIAAYGMCGSDMEAVEIPSSVKVIGKRAFKSCNKISKISVSNGVYELQEECMYLNENKNEINIYVPRSVKKIGKNVFSDNVIIYCKKTAPILKYAQKNNIRYIID